MEEGVAEVASDGGAEGAMESHGAAPISASGGHGGVEGAVEEGHGATPVLVSGGHGGAAEGGQGEGAVEASVVDVEGAAPEDHGRAALLGLHGQDGAMDGGHGAPKEGNDATAKESRNCTSAWREGMNPNSTYLLKIKLLGNPKKARKDIKCFCFEKVINSDLTNYMDLVESIVEQYPPRYLEVAHVQYYDDFLKIYPEGKSDQELVSMFEKHSKTKVVHMFVAYCDPSEPYEPITEWHSDVHSQTNNTEEEDDGYLHNPIPENEHVGVDEENIYLEDEPIPLTVVPCSDKKKDKDYVPDHEKCKKGNPDDIATTLAVRGPPKNRTKTTKSTQSSIVCYEDDALAASMCFPPSQSLETTTTKKRKHDNLEKTTKEKGKGSKSGSGGAKRSRTQPICVEHDVADKKTHVAVKVHAKRTIKEVAEKIPHLPMVPHDSPAMGTRSKKINRASPAMSTRQKKA